MTALPNKHYSGHCRAMEIEDDQKTRGKEIWRKKCGQQVSGTAGGKWRQQGRAGWRQAVSMIHWEHKSSHSRSAKWTQYSLLSNIRIRINWHKNV